MATSTRRQPRTGAVNTKRLEPNAATEQGATQAPPIEPPPLEGELLEPAGSLVPGQPPGRKPMPPLHVIPLLSSEEAAMLIADPHELLRRRAKDYIDFHHALISCSPSRVNRCAFGIESQRRAAQTLLNLAIPPARTAVDPLGDTRASTDQELLEILKSLGPDMRSNSSEGNHVD